MKLESETGYEMSWETLELDGLGLLRAVCFREAMSRIYSDLSEAFKNNMNVSITMKDDKDCDKERFAFRKIITAKVIT